MLEPSSDKDKLQNLLAKIGETFTVHFEPLDVDGQPLEALCIDDMPGYIERLIQGGAIHDPLKDLPLWAKIWPASFVLGRLLRKFEPAGKTMLELGAGMGICSMIAARYGFARITLTDLESDALDFARANILRNGLENVLEARQLDIRSPGPDPRFAAGVDFIVASEILYLDDLHRPLLKFVGRHLANNGRAFFCTDRARAKPAFKKLAAAHFQTREGAIGVKSRDEDGKEQRRVFDILILEKK